MGADRTTIIGNARIYALGTDGGPPPNGMTVENLRFLYDSAASGYLFAPSRGRFPYDPASPTIEGVTLRNVAFDGAHRGADGANGTYMDITGSRDITFNGIRVSLTGQAGLIRSPGQTDVNGDGNPEQVFTNTVSQRWATLSTDPVTGQVDYFSHGQGGSTRVVGIYRSLRGRG